MLGKSHTSTSNRVPNLQMLTCDNDRIEYAQECYCGNQIAGGGVQQACNLQQIMTCAGNPYEYCGGPGFMSLYYSPTL